MKKVGRKNRIRWKERAADFVLPRRGEEKKSDAARATLPREGVFLLPGVWGEGNGQDLSSPNCCYPRGEKEISSEQW